jgi:hypothetical protein
MPRKLDGRDLPFWGAYSHGLRRSSGTQLLTPSMSLDGLPTVIAETRHRRCSLGCAVDGRSSHDYGNLDWGRLGKSLLLNNQPTALRVRSMRNSPLAPLPSVPTGTSGRKRSQSRNPTRFSSSSGSDAATISIAAHMADVHRTGLPHLGRWNFSSSPSIDHATDRL